MPRYNLTEEEYSMIEKIRNKNREAVGRNEAIDQIILLIQSQPIRVAEGDSPEKVLTKWREDILAQLPGLKREYKR